MKTDFLIASLLICLLPLLASSCGFEGDEWQTELPKIGSSSSPAATDLNGDGIKDIVIGGGAKEFTQTATGITAIDGANGSLLWSVPAHNQIVGSPVFQDINKDGVQDIFIGGRSAIFMALDGKTGDKIWEFLPYDAQIDYVNDTTILNFFNPQFIHDVDEDGFLDLITAYGGFVKAQHGDENRPAGLLMILSGKTGKTLTKTRMPDGKETYLSPIVYDFGQGAEVVFGSGGEDIKGNLYRIPLAELLNGSDTIHPTAILSGGEKGFIAPPVLADVNEDNIKDIVVCTVDGRLVAISGSDNDILWTAKPGGEFDTYTMPGPGFFTGDDQIPDFFASFGKGAWPTTEYTVHLLVDGKTGQVVFKDTLGTFQYASPLIADFTKDGKDDVLLAINTRTTQDVLGDPTEFYANGLYVYPGGQGPVQQAFLSHLGSNLGSTPLLDDLDGDGHIDIVTAYMSDAQNFYSFKNLVVERREISPNSSRIHWGNYMGPQGKGIMLQQ
jgi:outer membrane protein assembly factor BamB